MSKLRTNSISDSLLAGGDDVQQLCEAGEEEFLEIMMLVDMASKPLHVRRLQKALQEWVQNPGEFTIFTYSIFLVSVILAALDVSYVTGSFNDISLYSLNVVITSEIATEIRNPGTDNPVRLDNGVLQR